MTTMSTITLAGGIKAPSPHFAAPAAANPISPAFTAFTRLCEALAEACAAEELRADDASWDLAMADPDAAAEDALNGAVAAARAAGDAKIVLASDRKLVLAARFVSCALDIENRPDRENVLHFLDSSRVLWGPAAGGQIGRRAEALVERAVDRLMHLTDLLADDVHGDSLNVL